MACLLAASSLIQSPQAVLACLAALVGVLFWVESRPWAAPLFRFLPALVWVYFLPMIATTLGILPAGFPAGEVPLYSALVRFVLPGSLLLLITCSDLGAVRHAGLPALVLFLTGSAGVILGAVVALALFQGVLPADVWRGFGALSGSWIGGSVNMATLAAVFETPKSLFGQMVVLDTVVGYFWVGILIGWARRQEAFDRRIGARSDYLAAARKRVRDLAGEPPRAMTLADATGLVGLALAGGWGCMALGGMLPEFHGYINAKGWGILLVSFLGIGLSFTPARGLRSFGGDKLAYAGIYLMLAGFGAQANLREVASNPWLFAAGVVWMGVHVALLLVVTRLLRAPLFFLATGSTANVGGPASAPLVAQVYCPDLASIGVLLAVLGNTVGYYFGWCAGQLCRLVAGG